MANRTTVSEEIHNSFKNVYDNIKSDKCELLRGTGALMTMYIQNNYTFDEDHYPAQRYVKDQCGLFLQDVLLQCAKKNMTAKHLQEGLEDLHYLSCVMIAKDILAFRTLVDDFLEIIKIMKELINAVETISGCKPTNWEAVVKFIRREADRVQIEPRFVVGKISNFTDRKFLGSGAFGVVYRACLGKARCVVKFVPKQRMPYLEAAIADKCVATMINHPCLVKYYACFPGKDSYVTVMEYIKGVDVIRLLNRKSKLSEKLVRIVISQLGLALIHLHLKGFIHRDVKPSNMMITAGCRVKLIDFDTARVCRGKYDRRKSWGFMSRTAKEFEGGPVAGTVAFMAPEIYSNTGYGRALDWWALGVTTFELITGYLPFKLEKPIEKTKAAILSANYTWPKDETYGKNLKDFVGRCLTIKARERLASVHYQEFLRHSFFEGQDWEYLETAPILMNYDPIESILREEQLSNSACTIETTPQPTPTAAIKQARLLKSMSFEDSTEYTQNIFTFSSAGFIRAVDLLRTQKIPDDQTLYDPPELVYQEDEPTVYTFERF